jgi:hypothetical protein
LALEIVRDDPKATNSRLARRLAAQIEADRELLDLVIQPRAEHEVVLVRNYLEKQSNGGGGRDRARKDKKDRKDKDKDQAKAMGKKQVLQLGKTIFNLVAENGKRVGALSGKELDTLDASNASRSGFYRALRRHVKDDDAIVEETLGAEQLSAIFQRLGDVTQYTKHFS